MSNLSGCTVVVILAVQTNLAFFVSLIFYHYVTLVGRNASLVVGMFKKCSGKEV